MIEFYDYDKDLIIKLKGIVNFHLDKNDEDSKKNIKKK